MKKEYFLKFGHDDLIWVEETYGQVDEKYKAIRRDYGYCGYGNTPEDAVKSLIRYMQNDIKKIEEALLKGFE
ncbi:MAG: hypothetical protein EKK64_04960 [Neisseriaceae bacterium]|nr:MAG: hypothetical protein EKK64_04960 [Neisseriaceae bacterium]